MDERRNHNNDWNRIKIFIGLAATAFAVTLALVIGNRLSDEAMAVLAGAVCGVGAAIPTSLLVIAVSRRYNEPRVHLPAQQSMQHGMYPPVVVVAPSGGQQWPGDLSTLSPSMNAPMQRQFTVVGGAQEAQQLDAEEVNYYGRHS
ncbi:MAG: hypothetical protein GY832_12930 [Chloroflexi bacterium]|nr:hypothetical protein [Chloroflexota bacterium]